ncbi:hypothetical protein [Tahibacter amnicola]|uniref:Uncharacterized protein n=1 Tax=Tahibacter amnicola TaxID=2976241 RepID=A0ABY6BE97_9GAMM|nr:hypothetical protein [Tahibacter amnicola]UXI68363.1 hypothetical protein N4264_01545 [Tahibacter amnicola]
MSSHELSVSIRDKITAYQLAIENLPRPDIWLSAIRDRDDGSTPEGVFAVLDRIRMDFQMRIGDLRAELDRQGG